MDRKKVPTWWMGLKPGMHPYLDIVRRVKGTNSGAPDHGVPGQRRNMRCSRQAGQKRNGWIDEAQIASWKALLSFQGAPVRTAISDVPFRAGIAGRLVKRRSLKTRAFRCGRVCFRQVPHPATLWRDTFPAAALGCAANLRPQVRRGGERR